MNFKTKAISLLAKREYSRKMLAQRLWLYFQKNQERLQPTKQLDRDFSDVKDGVDGLIDSDHTNFELIKPSFRHQSRNVEMGTADTTAIKNQIEQVLDDLAREDWQSDHRYAYSFARTHAHWGHRRVMQELKQHIEDDDLLAQISELFKASEMDNLLNVWKKKFGRWPQDQKEREKQIRFLMSRGFTIGDIQRMMSTVDFDAFQDLE